MTIFIYGGSNSLRKDGWAPVFAKRLEDETIVNRSIGAATSLMAIFRLLTNAETGPKPGDTLVWEYALNEVNHIRQGYDRQTMNRNVERFIRECLRRRVNLVAAIFTPRSEEWADARDPMYDDLKSMLKHYEIIDFDVSLAWRKARGAARMAKALYLDNAHYGSDAELLEFIAEGVQSAIRLARVPRDAAPLSIAADSPLVVQLATADSVYKNALISVPLAAHRSTLVLGTAGRVIGAAALVYADTRSALRLEHSRIGHAGSWLNLSTTGIGKAEKPILKVFSLEAAGAAWDVLPGDELEILPLRRAKPIYAEYHVKANLVGMDASQPPAFIGLVIETAS